MGSLFRWKGVCMHLGFVGLLAAHLISGLSTKNTTPKPFTKHAKLPPLDVILADDWDSQLPYSAPLPVVYTNDLGSAEEWASSHLGKASPKNPLLLGWDMESTPYLPWLEHKYNADSYFGPAVLQLSTPQSALVFPIAQDGVGPLHKGGLPSFLHDVLEDPNIVPVGVGIDDDLVELYRWCLENGEECVAPSWAARSQPVLTRFDMGGIGITEANAGRTVGLARLVAGILEVILPKTKKLARTHWSRPGLLSRSEVSYAARDAWAGAAILERLGSLDPDRFGPAAISSALDTQINDDERPLRGIQQISNRQLLRKAAKSEWKELRDPLDADGNEKPPWTDEQKGRYEDLTQQMKELAPSRPTSYEVGSLGLELPKR
jgi:hypothetical protein